MLQHASSLVSIVSVTLPIRPNRHALPSHPNTNRDGSKSHPSTHPRTHTRPYTPKGLTPPGFLSRLHVRGADWQVPQFTRAVSSCARALPFRPPAAAASIALTLGPSARGLATPSTPLRPLPMTISVNCNREQTARKDDPWLLIAASPLLSATWLFLHKRKAFEH